MEHWDFHHEQFLDTRPLGRLHEVMSAVIDGQQGERLVMDFFYDDGSGVTLGNRTQQRWLDGSWEAYAYGPHGQISLSGHSNIDALKPSMSSARIRMM